MVNSKRLWLSLAVVVVFSIGAIGSGETKKEDLKQITTEKEDLSDNKSNQSDSNNEDISSASAADNEGTLVDASDEISDDVIINEQVLVDKDEVKVTAVEYVKDEIWGDGIKLLLENGTDKDVTISCDELIVNDYMVSDFFSSTVASGKKAYETLNISGSELEKIGISTIGKVEIYFRSYDSDTYDEIDNYDVAVIQTSQYENMSSPQNDEGAELYNDNGVRIVGKTVDENSFWGKNILLYIENNTGENITVSADDFSVNGFMMNAYFSATVYDGKKSISELDIMSSELEENDIDNIEEVELKFRVYNSDSWRDIFETDVISFSTK